MQEKSKIDRFLDRIVDMLFHDVLDDDDDFDDEPKEYIFIGLAELITLALIAFSIIILIITIFLKLFLTHFL